MCFECIFAHSLSRLSVILILKACLKYVALKNWNFQFIVPKIGSNSFSIFIAGKLLVHTTQRF